MGYNGKYNTGKKPPVFRLLLLALLVSALALGAFTLAKYTISRQNDTQAQAYSFYFESDLLRAGDITPENTYTLPAGTTQISFLLKNHIDDLRTADLDISYRAELSGTGSATKSGTLTGAQICDRAVTFTGLSAGEYTVTVTATAPYSAVLQAKFIIPAVNNQVQWSVSDAANSPVVRLTVKTNDYSGNVTISWPAGVAPDNTDPLLAGAVNTQSCTLSFSNNSEYTFLFFKSDLSAVYTKESGGFSVS